ncbi:MAG: hypothetical protein Q9216_005218 [Gyalolechia sp. 2 TL-2023]
MTQQPATVPQVFGLIRQKMLREGIYEVHPIERHRWLGLQLDQAEAQYPFMRDPDIQDYTQDYFEYSHQLSVTTFPPSIRTKEGVYDIMSERLDRNNCYMISAADHLRWAEAHFGKAQAQFAFMRGEIVEDYFVYVHHLFALKCRPKPSWPPPTSQQFWKAVFEYDPHGQNAPSISDLQRIIGSGVAGPYTIGKLYGKTTLKLLPAIGCLPAHPIPDFDPPFDFAATDSVAISYPDGHPSEELLAGKFQLPSSSGVQVTATIKAQDDDKLRRFAAIGWVITEQAGGRWEKTGHVLVVDMDDRAVRHRQPWLVLASEWPTDGDETPEGGFTLYAGDKVMRDDPNVPGVFPGDNNRTPICCIKPLQESKGGKPVISRLGDDFDFAPERLGGHIRARPSAKGPALARIMEWYWDPTKKQEVSYTTEGWEYMRYDRQTKEYSFPDFSKLSIAGQQGLFGELEAHAWGVADRPFVGLAQRLANTSLHAPAPHQHRKIDSTVGF